MSVLRREGTRVSTREQTQRRGVNWEIVIGIIAIVAPFVVFFLWQQDRKELAYDFVGASQILSISQSPSISGNLQVLLDGESISGLLNYTISIINSGNRPILPQDYVSPITIQLGDVGRIVSAEVRDANDSKLREDIKNGLNVENTPELKITLPETLLNPGDNFTINVITTQSQEVLPRVDARVVGVSRIIPNNERWEVKLFEFVTGNSERVLFIPLILVELYLIYVLIKDERKNRRQTRPLTMLSRRISNSNRTSVPLSSRFRASSTSQNPHKPFGISESQEGDEEE